MQKISRNDLCPCGSQKKHKNCCLKNAEAFLPFDYDIEWQRLRLTAGEISEKAFAFAREEWGIEILEDGWDAFFLGMDLEKDTLDGEHLFPGWFIFRWVPYDYSTKWEYLGPHRTIAELYQEKHSSKKNTSFLAALNQSPFSFYLVEEIIPHKRLVLRDLLLNNTIHVKEKAGAIAKAKGNIVFARLISLKDQAIQISSGVVFLPVRYGMHVLDLKKEILKKEKNLTPTSLMKYDNDLRRAYFEWSELAYQLPKFVNNDGNSILLCTLYYKLSCSPIVAFHQLASLCKGEDPNKLLEQEGHFSKNHELKAIEFPWFKSRSSDWTLGSINIKKGELIIFANSMERSKKIQKEIEKRLPEAVFEKIETVSPDEIKLKGPSKAQPAAPREISDNEKEMMASYLENHYREWPNTPLPVLHGMTPREAAKTAEGQERLNLLLYDFEKSNQTKNGHFRIDVQALREELGLLH